MTLFLPVVVALVLLVVVLVAVVARLAKRDAGTYPAGPAAAWGATGTLVRPSWTRKRTRVARACSATPTRTPAGRPCVARTNVRRSPAGALRGTDQRAICRPAGPPAATGSPSPPPPSAAPPAERPSGVPPLPGGIVLSRGPTRTPHAVGTCSPTGWWPCPADRPARWYVAPEGYAWVAFSWACPDDDASVFAYSYWDGYQWAYWDYAVRGLGQGPAG